MEVIEQSVIGKRSETLCEDGIVVTPDFVAVIDGSTSKSRFGAIKTGKTGGQLAMETIRELVCECGIQTDLETFCEEATRRIQQLYAQYYSPEILPQLKSHPEDRFCCSAVVFSRYWNEIWMIGDCQAMIVNRSEEEISVRRWTNNKPCEAAIALKRSKYLKKALAEGVTTIEKLCQHDIGREVILPELVKAMQGENLDYAVIDGFPIPMRKVKRIRQAWDENTEIILASDGYPRLFPSLRETEDYLKRCLVVDPLCIGRHKATKGWMVGYQSFDDRAYIRFK